MFLYFSLHSTLKSINLTIAILSYTFHKFKRTFNNSINIIVSNSVFYIFFRAQYIFITIYPSTFAIITFGWYILLRLHTITIFSIQMSIEPLFLNKYVTSKPYMILHDFTEYYSIYIFLLIFYLILK